MAFRKFGGLEYNKTNNYVSANTTNNMKLNISDHIGKLNTKIVVDSHLDLNNQSMFNVGNIYFSNGADLQSLADNLDLLSSNNIWSGINTFTKSTNFKDITCSTSAISVATITSIVASSIVSEDLSSTTGKFNTISSKQGNLVCNSNIDLSKNDITNIKSLTSSVDIGNTGAFGQVITADGSGGWSWEDGSGGVTSITAGDGIVVSPSTGDVIISTTLLETSNTWSSTNTFSSEAIFANGIDMSGKNISKIDTLSGNNAPINCGSLLMDGDIDMDTFTIKNLNAISLGTVNGTTQLSTNTISVGTTASLQSLGIGDTANTGNINYGGVSQSCYSSDLSTATLSDPGLYFGRNLGGDNEFNMIALTDGDTGPLLNIYASYQNINGIGVTGATSPVLSLIKLNTSNSQNLLEIDGAVSCGQANYGSRTINDDGLYFCRNLTNGGNEYDIVAVNNTTATSLNIYTGTTGIAGYNSGSYTPPLVSMNQTEVNITGNMSANQVQCSSFYQNNLLTFNVTQGNTASVSYPNPTTITTLSDDIIVQSTQTFDILNDITTIYFNLPASNTNINDTVTVGTTDYFIWLKNNKIYFSLNVGDTGYPYYPGNKMTIILRNNAIEYFLNDVSIYSTLPTSYDDQKFWCYFDVSTTITGIGGYQGTPNNTGAVGQVITANGSGGWSWQDGGGGGTGVLGIAGGANITVTDNAGNYTIGATGLAILNTSTEQTFTGPLNFGNAGNTADTCTFNNLVYITRSGSGFDIDSADGKIGCEFYFNQQVKGETDLVTYGQGSAGGLSIYSVGNTGPLNLVANFFPDVSTICGRLTLNTGGTGGIAGNTGVTLTCIGENVLALGHPPDSSNGTLSCDTVSIVGVIEDDDYNVYLNTNPDDKSLVVNCTADNTGIVISCPGRKASITCPETDTIEVKNLKISSDNGTSYLKYYSPTNISLSMEPSETFYIQYPDDYIMTFGDTAINAHKPLKIYDAFLYLVNGEENSQFEYSSDANQLTIYNNSLHTDNTANIAFNLNNSSGEQSPVNIMQIYSNKIDVNKDLNLNEGGSINVSGNVYGNGSSIPMPYVVAYGTSVQTTNGNVTIPLATIVQVPLGYNPALCVAILTNGDFFNTNEFLEFWPAIQDNGNGTINLLARVNNTNTSTYRINYIIYAFK